VYVVVGEAEEVVGVEGVEGRDFDAEWHNQTTIPSTPE